MNPQVLVIVALKEEFEAIEHLIAGHKTRDELEALPRIRTSVRRDDGLTIDLHFITIDEMGNEVSALATERISAVIQPSLIVNLGIAGRLSKEVSLGDVVVATSVDNYILQAKAEQKDKSLPFDLGDVRFAGDALSASDVAVPLFRNLPLVDRSTFNALRLIIQKTFHDHVRPQEHQQLRDLRLVTDDWKIVCGDIASGPFLSASEKFVKWLVDNRNRKFFAIEMEAYGVVLASRKGGRSVPSVIIKGISDPSTEEKGRLEEMTRGGLRKWAMENAMRCFILLLDRIVVEEGRVMTTRSSLTSAERTENEVLEELHQFFMPPHTASLENISAISWEVYSRLFSILSRKSWETSADMLPNIAQVIAQSKETVPLEIVGQPGTGKSFFLQVLYWFLSNNTAPDAIIPVYMDCHAFNRRCRRNEEETVLARRIEAEIEEIIEKLWFLVERRPTRTFVFLIDGYDEHARFKRNVTAQIIKLTDALPHKKVVGSRDLTSDFAPFASQGAMRLHFQALSLKDEKFSEYLEILSQIVAPREHLSVYRRVAADLATSRLKKVDLFVSALLCRHASIRPDAATKISDLIETRCHQFLSQRGETNTEEALTQCANVAFRSEILQEPDAFERDNSGVCRDLIEYHPRFADYLIARYVLNEIRRIAEQGVKRSKVSRYVYPFRVNAIAKELLNRDITTQKVILKAIRKVLQARNADSHTQAHFCYLAGRLEDQQVRKQALSVLTEFKHVLNQRAVKKEDKQRLLLFRTAYISLAYLGDKVSQAEYVRRLLSDTTWDRLNRGFHLEYYGDIPFTPSLALLSDDSLDECPLTFEQLRVRLLQRNHNPIFEVEVQTFCSLAQHRHAAGRLGEQDRTDVARVLGEIMKGQRIEEPRLRAYVRMVSKHLKIEKFVPSGPIRQLLRLKETKREGWINRGLAACESVADHTLGTLIIAKAYLPAQLEGCPAYSKTRIVDLLLIHDWAEAFIGDCVPEKRTDVVARLEREHFEEIALLNTYEEIEDLEDVGELWDEFELAKTINGEIARDIDRIENLVQLDIYEQGQWKASDSERWRASLAESLRTHLGRLILRRIMGRAPDNGGTPLQVKDI